MNIKEIIKKLDVIRDQCDARDSETIGAAVIILESLAEAPQAYLRKMSKPEIILHRRDVAPQSHAVLNILLLEAQGIHIPDPSDDPEWIKRGSEFRAFFEGVRSGAIHHQRRPKDEEEQ